MLAEGRAPIRILCWSVREARLLFEAKAIAERLLGTSP
jgi:hypothetical protein